MATLQFASNLLLRFFHHHQQKSSNKNQYIIGIRGSRRGHIISTPTPPPVLRSRRRGLNVSVLLLFFYGFSPTTCRPLLARDFLELVRYTDSQQAFTLLRPSSWVEVHKPGATVLFEDQSNKGANNVGVVVNPVRLITTLPDFGTPHFVAQMLIHAEKQKESTKDAALVGVAVRSGEGGVQVYEFEYTVDSTRGGMKRVFSAAFVASNKLYILNISHSDKPDSPLDSHTRRMLEQVLHSFDAAAPPPSL